MEPKITLNRQLGMREGITITTGTVIGVGLFTTGALFYVRWSGNVPNRETRRNNVGSPHEFWVSDVFFLPFGTICVKNHPHPARVLMEACCLP